MTSISALRTSAGLGAGAPPGRLCGFSIGTGPPMPPVRLDPPRPRRVGSLFTDEIAAWWSVGSFPAPDFHCLAEFMDAYSFIASEQCSALPPPWLYTYADNTPSCERSASKACSDFFPATTPREARSSAERAYTSFFQVVWAKCLILEKLKRKVLTGCEMNHEAYKEWRECFDGTIGWTKGEMRTAERVFRRNCVERGRRQGDDHDVDCVAGWLGFDYESECECPDDSYCGYQCGEWRKSTDGDWYWERTRAPVPSTNRCGDEDWREHDRIQEECRDDYLGIR